MLQVEPYLADPAPMRIDGSRAAVRAVTDLLLSIAVVGADLVDDDLALAIVWAAVVERSAAKLRRSPAKWAAYVESGTVLPDEQRPPVSVYSLSRMLEMPYETTRRHVMRLIAAGRLAKAPRGVIAPAAYMNSSPVRAASAELQVRLRRCLIGLEKLGVVRLGPSALDLLGGGDRSQSDPYVDEARRKFTRITVHFAVEGFKLLSQSAGGNLLGGLLFAGIVQANVSQISANPALSRQYGGFDLPPPDELRRPVSIYSLAQSLRLPYETARRNILQLMEAGLVRREKKGVMAPSAVLLSPAILSQAPLAFDLFRKFVAALAEADLDVDLAI